jgi:tRNA nucleotidyltransferase (CCA-adding enzyme)
MDAKQAAARLSSEPWDPALLRVLGGIAQQGGLPLVVGGAVRDALLGRPSHKDVDIEVHGISQRDLVSALVNLGLEADEVGASFGVVKVKGMAVDFSLPRRDSKTGTGHKGFEVSVDPEMGVAEACRRRDLTVNSMAYDPLARVLHDPFHGLEDMEAMVLRPTDEGLFLDDPLRALRAAQFLSRLDGFKASGLLSVICAKADLRDLSGERVFEEMQKLLLGSRPSVGLEFMRFTGMLLFFPELQALVGCEQDPEWHPEGDVWTHTCMAADQARELSEDLIVLWAVLCHDLGKPPTTTFEDGKFRSRGHEEAGVAPTRALLSRMRAPNALVEAVCALVSCHLAPAMWCGKSKAGPGAYRRLARKLSEAGTDLEVLYLVSKADHFGRTTQDAVRREFPSGDEFLGKARVLKVDLCAEDDVVMGRHLLERGMRPSPGLGAALRKCREVQYETGLKDATEIIRIAGVCIP